MGSGLWNRHPFYAGDPVQGSDVAELSNPGRIWIKATGCASPRPDAPAPGVRLGGRSRRSASVTSVYGARW